MLRRAVLLVGHIYMLTLGDTLQVIDFCGVATVVPVNHRME